MYKICEYYQVEKTARTWRQVRSMTTRTNITPSSTNESSLQYLQKYPIKCYVKTAVKKPMDKIVSEGNCKGGRAELGSNDDQLSW